MGEIQRENLTAPEVAMFLSEQMEGFIAVNRKRQLRTDRIGIARIAVTFTAAVDVHTPYGFAGAVDFGKQLFDMRRQSTMKSESVDTVQDQICLIQFFVERFACDDAVARESALCVLCGITCRISVRKENTAAVFLCQFPADDKAVTAVIAFSAQDQDGTSGFEILTDPFRNCGADLFHKFFHRNTGVRFDLLHSFFISYHADLLSP